MTTKSKKAPCQTQTPGLYIMEMGGSSLQECQLLSTALILTRQLETHTVLKTQ